jgi:hypothetical protein
MRLIDQINVATEVVVDNAMGARFRVKTAADFRLAIRATPHRYILDDAATRLCAELAVLDTQLLYKSFDILRLPAERLWIEWRERPRVEALESARVDFASPTTIANDSRGGLLIEADGGGRSGSAWLFTGDKDRADVFPLYLQFSTEGFMPPPPRGGFLSTFSLSNSAVPNLKPVLDHCLLRVEASWADYCRRSTQGVDEANRYIETLAGKVWFDWPFIAAFLLLYQTRSAFRARPSDLAQLNSARAKRGKIALLEHVEIGASLGGRGLGDAAASVTRDQAGKRLHHVRGHLVRRGDNLHWRSPHLRGDSALGVIATRTVRVRA